MLPSRSMPYGTACMLVCPTCHEYGRSADDATIVHKSRGRRRKDGAYANNHFQHLHAPDNPNLACYRKHYDYAHTSDGGGGGGETLVHALGAEFVGWWLGEGAWEWEDLRSGARYPDSDFRFDAVITSGGATMAIEAEVTHRLERDKVKFLKRLDWAVLVLDLSHPDVREWLHPRLTEWDHLTNTDNENEMPLAKEIYDYMVSHNVFQPLENDYYVRNNRS